LFLALIIAEFLKAKVILLSRTRKHYGGKKRILPYFYAQNSHDWGEKRRFVCLFAAYGLSLCFKFRVIETWELI